MTIRDPLNNENRLSEWEAFKQKLGDLNRRLADLYEILPCSKHETVNSIDSVARQISEGEDQTDDLK